MNLFIIFKLPTIVMFILKNNRDFNLTGKIYDF